MRETRSSGSVEGVVGNHDPYSDCLFLNRPAGGTLTALIQPATKSRVGFARVMQARISARVLPSFTRDKYSVPTVRRGHLNVSNEALLAQMRHSWLRSDICRPRFRDMVSRTPEQAGAKIWFGEDTCSC